MIKYLSPIEAFIFRMLKSKYLKETLISLFLLKVYNNIKFKTKINILKLKHNEKFKKKINVNNENTYIDVLDSEAISLEIALKISHSIDTKNTSVSKWISMWNIASKMNKPKEN